MGEGTSVVGRNRPSPCPLLGYRERVKFPRGRVVLRGQNVTSVGSRSTWLRVPAPRLYLSATRSCIWKRSLPWLPEIWSVPVSPDGAALKRSSPPLPIIVSEPRPPER